MNQYQENHRALSRTNAEFLEYAREQKQCLRPLQLLDGDLPRFLQPYPYKVNSWPIFIAGETISRLSECATYIPKLVLKCLDPARSYYFKRIVEVCHFDDALIRRFCEIDVSKQIICRLDLVGTAEGFKVLETNSGSDIGGWQIQFLDNQYRNQEPIRRFMQRLRDVSSRDILRCYMRTVLAACDALGLGKDGGLTFLYVVDSPTREEVADAMIDCLTRIGAEFGRELRIFFETDLSAVRAQGGRIAIHGRTIDGYFPAITDVKAPVNWAIFDTFCNGQLVWPDNPISACLNDKSLLATLYREQDSDRFSDEEKALIRAHVAWGSWLANEEAVFEGDTHDLRRLLTTRKDAFVVKPLIGGQGRHVSVGRYMEQKAWEEKLKSVYEAPVRWVAQKHCESLKYYAQAGEESSELVEYVWGAFSYSHTYGGAWVRLKGADDNATGVINSHTGAQETIVYEVAE